MLAWHDYQLTVCPGCGHPRATAWHPDNEGWFEVTKKITCHACTARDATSSPEGATPRPVEYPVVSDTRDYTAKPLPAVVNQSSQKGGD